MAYSRRVLSSEPGRLEALRTKHAALKDLIREEQKRPAGGEDVLRRLKLEKLRLKEHIEEEERRT